jgi:hypothetical protein
MRGIVPQKYIAGGRLTPRVTIDFTSIMVATLASRTGSSGTLQKKLGAPPVNLPWNYRN